MKTRRQTRASLPVAMDIVSEGMEGEESGTETKSKNDQASFRSVSPVSPLPRRKRSAKARKNTKQGNTAIQMYGKLGGVLALPVEVFTEITRHLSPIDIISLSRSNKVFRGLLMKQSAAHIWRTALQNVPNLPPCPKDLREPQYAALLFKKNCSLCGEGTMRSMDPYLNVRLCNACRDEQLVYVSEIEPESLAELVHQSPISQIKPGKTQVDTCLRAEKEEIESIWEDICTGNATSDAATIGWMRGTARACEERIKYAELMVKYLKSLVDTRSKELDQLKEERRQEIKQRLEESGWEEPDWLFPSKSNRAQEWTNLVEAAKPLTDRVWQKLYPQLVPLLEENRRQSALLSMDKRIIVGTIPSVHTGSPNEAEDEDTSEENTSIATNDDVDAPNPIANVPKFELRAPFPPIVDALKLPIISDLLEEDVSSDTMEAMFEASRADIEQIILNWCELTEEHLVNTLQSGTSNSDEASSEFGSETGSDTPLNPILELGFKPPTNSNFLDILRSNTQLLLRADSVFRVANDELSPPPLYYPDMFSVFQEKSTGYFGPQRAKRWYFSGRPRVGFPWNSSDVTSYPEGVAAAKALLRQLDRPNASQFEFQILGPRFSCGLCGEKWWMTWNEIVQHYAEAQTHAHQAEQAKASITYINSHRLDLGKKAKGKGKPLVILHSWEEFKAMVSGAPRMQKLMECGLCGELDIRFRAPRDAMLKHVRAVHAISAPKAENYSHTSDIQWHIRIGDPDIDTYDTDTDDSNAPPHDMEQSLSLYGPAARWIDWTPRRALNKGWGGDEK